MANSGQREGRDARTDPGYTCEEDVFEGIWRERVDVTIHEGCSCDPCRRGEQLDFAGNITHVAWRFRPECDSAALMTLNVLSPHATHLRTLCMLCEPNITTSCVMAAHEIGPGWWLQRRICELCERASVIARAMRRHPCSL